MKKKKKKYTFQLKNFTNQSNGIDVKSKINILFKNMKICQLKNSYLYQYNIRDLAFQVGIKI